MIIYWQPGSLAADIAKASGSKDTQYNDILAVKTMQYGTNLCILTAEVILA